MSTHQPGTAPRPAHRRFTRPEPVSVNGVVIPNAAIARETQHHRAADPDQAWILAARALVIRELLSQEAERLSIAADPIDDGEGRRETSEEARMRALIDREVAVPRADGAACRRYYDANIRRFRSSDLFEAAHILFAAAPDDATTRDKAREAATALIAGLLREPAGLPFLETGRQPRPSRHRPDCSRVRDGVARHDAGAGPSGACRNPLWPAHRTARPSRRR
jgi:peptidyl-prolyl cis-trans isomerase C